MICASRRTSQLTFGTRHELIEPWIRFFLCIAREQVDEALSLLSMSRLEQHLSDKQQTVWQYFASHAGDDISIGVLTGATGVNRLLTLKLIERFGAGRSTRYRVTTPVR